MSKTPELRLDRSRDFSEAHGERSPQDPHYRVYYFQDKLPFGADELLVADDGKKDSWTESVEREDGTTKIVRHWPLYDDKMRAILDKKLKKLSSQKRVVTKPQRAEADDDGDDQQLMFGPDEVNLSAWLKGEIDYEPNEIFAAVKKRYSVQYSRLREVVIELVEDQNLVPQAEVSPRLLALTNEPQHSSAAA